MSNHDTYPDYSLFDELPILIIVIDINFKIVLWNKHIQAVTKIREEERVGYNLLDLYPRLDKVAFKSRIESVLQGGPPCTFSHSLHKYFIEIPTTDGEFKRHNTVIKHHSPESEEEDYAVIMMIDMTDLHKQNDKIKEIKAGAIVQLEKSNAQLQSFASSVAHDVRTPLGNIKGLCQVLLETAEENRPYSEDDTNIVNMIKDSAGRLNDLTADLLSYSKATNVNEPEEIVKLNEIIKNIKNDLFTFIEKSSSEIIIKNDLPEIHGWYFLIRQLFQNIIVNSIKYKKPTTDPVILISVENKDKKFKITIEDNGIGFTEEEASLIFEPFQRLHAKHKVEGTGIGLATCKRIMEQHNGTIEAIGQVGKGAKFVIVFPQR